MNSACAVIYCYILSCAFGIHIQDKSTMVPNLTEELNPTEEHATKEDLVNNILIDPINESELYENGQENKKNDPRSYIVLNHKFKSHFFDGKSLPLGNNNRSYDFSLIAFNTINGNQINSFPPQLKTRTRGHRFQTTTRRTRSERRKHRPAAKDVRSPKSPLVRLVPVSSVGRPVVYGDQSPVSTQFLKFYLHPAAPRLAAWRYTTKSPASTYVRVAAKPHSPIVWNYYKNPQLLPQHKAEQKQLRRNNTHAVFDFDDEVLSHYLRNAVTPDTPPKKSNINRYTCYNPNCKIIFNNNKQTLNNGVRKNSKCVCDDATKEDKLKEESQSVNREALDQILKDLKELAERNEIKRDSD